MTEKIETVAQPKEVATKKVRIMYMTDHSRTSGFGIVADAVCSGLAQKGFEVFYIGWGFHASEPLQRGNYTLLPCSQAPFGEDVLGQYLFNMKPDILITQADTRMIAYIPEVLKQLPNKPVWINYPVIDGTVWDVECTRTKWPTNWTNILKSATKTIAMTDFGRDIMKANGIDSETIYHGVNTAIFKPINKELQADIRKNVGIAEDAFIFGGVFKNMQRKNPQQYLQAFKIFLEKLPEKEREKVILLLHTNPHAKGGSEIDLISHAENYGIPPKNIIFSAGMLPMQNMPYLYQAMDVYLQLGGMEGFCVPLIEAMACGLPVIANDSATHKEIVADSGIISPSPTFAGHPKARVTYGSYNGIEADIANPWLIAHDMMKVYKDKTLRESLSVKAAERATQLFDWAGIITQWVKAVESQVVTEDQIPEEWKKLYAETNI